MFTPTEITVPKKLLKSLTFDNLDSMKTPLNQPTGDFFYDQWILKPEYKNTAWEQLLRVLPTDVGEARIIVLESGTNYFQHADIDDRYHLNLFGKDSYLIDLEQQKMYELKQDGIWYIMNAGTLHSAANFGEHKRIQLVVRRLLSHNNIENSCKIQIIGGGSNPRFVFDNTISPWLNKSNQKGIIDNFHVLEHGVEFDITKKEIKNLKKLIPKDFKLILV